ncbi:uncharacterized protein LOC133887306 [Phragmites australis]|uniref:uncharacterized protein LOC133887306 n=1 Tax=Phragmites australis TaxID=29695 RepID=UPI002D793225|nr:uncharacterized protein LOC133887306 [Phragmites australis]
MKVAIPEMFPGIVHRLCRWHVVNKVQTKLNELYELHKELKDVFNSTINHPLTPTEFESAWAEMLSRFKLQDDPTLRSLYNIRERWVKAFFKHKYCGRMTSTQRSESTNMMVKNNFVNHTTVLHKFAKQMLKVIQRRRAAEAAEEYGGMCRTDESGWGFVDQLRRVYTRRVFEQVESIPGSYIVRRYTRNARMELPFDRHDERLVGPDGTTQKYRQTTLLVVAMAIVRAGSMSRPAYDKAMKDLKILRGHIENLPADIGHSQGETSTITSRQGWEQTYSSQATDGMCTEENHDENIHTTTVNGIMESRAPHINNMVNIAPPPKAKTKGRRVDEGEKRTLGARGPKKCNRACKLCGITNGHNRGTCPENPKNKDRIAKLNQGPRKRGRPKGSGKSTVAGNKNKVCRSLDEDLHVRRVSENYSEEEYSVGDEENATTTDEDSE